MKTQIQVSFAYSTVQVMFLGRIYPRQHSELHTRDQTQLSVLISYEQALHIPSEFVVVLKHLNSGQCGASLELLPHIYLTMVSIFTHQDFLLFPLCFQNPSSSGSLKLRIVLQGFNPLPYNAAF